MAKVSFSFLPFWIFSYYCLNLPNLNTNQTFSLFLFRKLYSMYVGFNFFALLLVTASYKCEHEEADREVIDEILSDVFVEENVGDAADNTGLHKILFSKKNSTDFMHKQSFI